jgi:hypothetical protein
MPAKPASTDSLAPLRRRLAAVDRMLTRYPDPWRAGSPWQFAATAMREIRAALAKRRPRGVPTAEFLTRADAFLQSLLIAERVGYCRQRRADRVGWLSNAKFAVESIRLGHVRTLRGLADLETASLTEWWEGVGAVVDRFWREIRRARLPYERRDIGAEIKDAGRLRTREQYEWAVDMIGELGEREARALSRMIDAYESRAAR